LSIRKARDPEGDVVVGEDAGADLAEHRQHAEDRQGAERLWPSRATARAGRRRSMPAWAGSWKTGGRADQPQTMRNTTRPRMVRPIRPCQTMALPRSWR
jgi:hypothetical protein